MLIVKWCIFYVDGSRYDNTDGPPEEAPGSGVAAVVQQDDTVGASVHYHHLRDFYVFAEEYGGWAALDVFGLSQYLADPGFKIVKLGKFMTTEGYKKLIRDIREDPSLPSKSARYEWEAPF